MPRLEDLHMPVIEQTDPHTGRRVWKLTAWDDSHCVATYFYYQPMTPDEHHVVFGSDRTGRFELYRLELASGQAVQLTEHDEAVDPDAHRGIWRCHIHPNGREVLYCDVDGLRATDLYSCESRLVCSSHQPQLGEVRFVPNVTDDGRYSIGSFKRDDGRSGLMRVPLAGDGAPEVLYVHDDPEQSIGHIVPATAAGVVASFNVVPDRQDEPDQPPHRRARAWRLTTDGNASPFLVMPPGHRCTHEYWGPDGRLYCHKKTVPTWTPTSIISIDGQTGQDEREHFTSADRKLGHSFISRDGKWITSDVQDQTGNELYLIQRDTGHAEILCWPNSTVDAHNGQLSHVHPWFSPSGRHVGFTSDRSGKAAVFLVPDAVKEAAMAGG